MPIISSIFGPHTQLKSASDMLVYNKAKGQIETHSKLSADDQAEFEKREQNLRLRLDATVQSAHDDYKKELRALFVEFGQIAVEVPVELTYVEPKTQDVLAQAAG